MQSKIFITKIISATAISFRIAFFLAVISLLLSAPLKAAQPQTENPDQKVEGIIYVSSNAVIVGASSFSNAKIVTHPDNKIVKKKVTVSAVSRQMAADQKAEKQKSQKLRKLQESINRKIAVYYSGSLDVELKRLAKSRLNISADYRPFSAFKFSASTLSKEHLLTFFIMQKVRRKILLFLPYSTFLTLRPSFLRGPPVSG